MSAVTSNPEINVAFSEATGLVAEFRSSMRGSRLGRAIGYIKSVFGIDTRDWPWIATRRTGDSLEAFFSVYLSYQSKDIEALNWFENKLKEACAFGISVDEDESGEYTFRLSGSTKESMEIVEDLRDFARDFVRFERNEWRKAA